jgi:TolB-like protein
VSEAPDIFLSYSREDQPTARRFAEALEQEGFSVWWDQTLDAGETYDEVTANALDSATAAVVLWSSKSVGSRWVRAEATLADRQSKLIPALIETCRLPIQFELTQTADLSGWSGDRGDPRWQSFVAGLRRACARQRPAQMLQPAGRTEAPPSPAPQARGPRRNRGLYIGIGAAVILGLTVVAWKILAGREATAPAAAQSPAQIASPGARAATAAQPSIAVLPFVNMSSDPEQEYFSDGLTEELLNELAQVPDLRVIGRTSSFAFKGKTGDLRRIGEELGVNNLLEGSVRKAGDRVVITAQLINAADGSHLWSGKYERQLDDIFAIQEEIARNVAGELQLRMSPEGTHVGTRNLAAYDEFLAGRAALNTSAQSAVPRLQRAVALDPSFVTAWLWLIDAYTRLALAESGLRDQAVLGQDEAIARVVALVPGSPEASFAMSYREARGHDLITLERLLREASVMKGGQGVRARFRHAQFLSSVGRLRESIEAFERVIREEPLDVFMRTNLLLALELAGEYAKAESAMQEILVLPGGRSGSVLGTAITRAMGQRDTARLGRAIDDASEFSLPGATNLNMRMRPLLTDPSRARAELHGMLADPAIRENIYGYSGFLQWGAYFGDVDLSLQLLQTLARQQFNFETWAWILWRPVMVDVRRDPRSHELMRDIGLADYWRATGNWGDFCKPVGDEDFECR